jgi:DHA1 family tetracycline resistance protein-like MFS transporter
MSRLLILFLTVFVSMTGFGIVVPIAPFFGLHLGESATAITIALGGYSLGQLVAAPLWGRLSDKIGRRPVIIVTLALTALSYLALAQANTILAIGAIRFAAGLAAGNIGAGFAAAADLSTPENRARAMGVVGAGFGLGFIIGPMIGGLIGGHDPDQADFARVCYVAMGMAGSAALLAFFFFKETKPADLPPRPKGATRQLMRRPALQMLIWATLLGVTAQACFEMSFGLWADHRLGWGPPQIGINLGAIGLLAALLQGAGAGFLAKRYGEARILMVGYASFALGFALLALADNAPLAMTGAAFLGAGAGLTGPPLQSLTSKQARAEETGAALGLQQSASAMGRVLGPLAAGPLFDTLGPASPFAFASVLSLAALWFAISGARAPRPVHPASP